MIYVKKSPHAHLCVCVYGFLFLQFSTRCHVYMNITAKIIHMNSQITHGARNKKKWKEEKTTTTKTGPNRNVNKFSRYTFIVHCSEWIVSVQEKLHILHTHTHTSTQCVNLKQTESEIEKERERATKFSAGIVLSNDFCCSYECRKLGTVRSNGKLRGILRSILLGPPSHR